MTPQTAAALRALERNETAYEILQDLVAMDSEKWAIGGGHRWKEREEAIWKRARELFEP